MDLAPFTDGTAVPLPGSPAGVLHRCPRTLQGRRRSRGCVAGAGRPACRRSRLHMVGEGRLESDRPRPRRRPRAPRPLDTEARHARASHARSMPRRPRPSLPQRGNGACHHRGLLSRRARRRDGGRRILDLVTMTGQRPPRPRRGFALPLAAALERVLTDARLAARLGAGALTAATDWVATPEQFAARVRELVDAVLARARLRHSGGRAFADKTADQEHGLPRRRGRSATRIPRANRPVAEAPLYHKVNDLAGESLEHPGPDVLLSAARRSRSGRSATGLSGSATFSATSPGTARLSRTTHGVDHLRRRLTPQPPRNAAPILAKHGFPAVLFATVGEHRLPARGSLMTGGSSQRTRRSGGTIFVAIERLGRPGRVARDHAFSADLARRSGGRARTGRIQADAGGAPRPAGPCVRLRQGERRPLRRAPQDHAAAGGLRCCVHDRDGGEPGPAWTRTRSAL